MSDEKLSPERAVRLLRAKGGELEHRVLIESETLDEPMTTLGLNMMVTGLMADIALIAQLLADHIERTDATVRLYVAHTENLIERVNDLEGGDE